MADVVLKNVSKSYDKKNLIVDNISLEIKDKEFVILVGPSGCGKTTTLRMIAGLEQITAGKLYINGKCVNDLPPKDRDIAMVFQNYALYPHMNVFENMAFGLKLRKYEKKEIERRVMEAAEILELKNYLYHKPKELSGGQRQRVAVGRAIVRQPQVFLFDEPLSNLDAKLRVQMRAELSKLHKKLGVTMIYVTHDQVEAMTMGDRIAVMHKGKIQQFDTPLNIYNKPSNKFTAGFIGSPSMNFVESKLLKKDNGYFIDFLGAEIKLPNKFQNEKLEKYINQKIIVGIRPEDFIEPNFQQFNNNPKIKGIIEITEQMGAESYYYFRCNDKMIVVRTRHLSLKISEKIEVTLNLEKIHLFDGITEESI